jgi:hypothetical protein
MALVALGLVAFFVYAFVSYRWSGGDDEALGRVASPAVTLARA